MLEPRDSVAWPRVEGYASMVKEGRIPFPVDPKFVSLPEGEIGGSVNMCAEPPVHMHEYYTSGDTLREPEQASLYKTKRCLMVKDGQRWQVCELVKSPLDERVVELVNEEPVKINGLFAAEKNVTKQRLILDA